MNKNKIHSNLITHCNNSSEDNFNNSYSQEYSAKRLKSKILNNIGRLSHSALKSVITLKVMLKSPDVPKFVKVTIIGALGYLICPVDLIPDFLPGGFIDDLAVITLLLSEIAIYKTDKINKEIESSIKKYQKS